MAATTVDEVLAQLQQTITDCENRNDRAGYFASLYYKVTDQVRQGIANNDFEDGARMERLDVLFANRYLDALDSWRNDRPLTRSWQVALDATRQTSLLTLQHLLLGINAHINLDLGIAAVETARAQGQPIQTIHKDFDAINAILGALTYQVLHDVNQISPLISLLGVHENHTESILIQFSIGNARDGAWCFAEALSPLTGDAQTAAITQRDNDIAVLARQLVTTRGFIRLTVALIHLFEWKNPRRIMRVLNGYKKSFIQVRPGAAAGVTAGVTAGTTAGVTAGAAAAPGAQSHP